MSTSSLRDRLIQAAGDRYSIDDELGRGGMAVVFAATDTRLKRAVAIKALPPELAFRGDVKSRFIREAQMAAALSHPNIVPIYSVDEADGLVFMVMGRVRGESLAQRLHRDGRMPFAETRRVLRETADALAAAHALGVIHRDIKPDNILLDEKSGRAMVTDFGIARALEGDSRLTATGVAVGTPTYMSPEQARGDDDVDGRADVYALGVVGYQMLAGEPPFIAPNTPALLLKHVSEPPPPLAGRRPDVPPALAYAVTKALAKDRRDRWASAAVMREALADNAVAPPDPVLRQYAPVAAASPPARPALPPHPVWPAGPDALERFRDARRAWKEHVKEQNREFGRQGVTIGVHIARDAMNRAAEKRSWRKSLAQRVAAFQRHVISNVFLMFVLFVINASAGGHPWFIFPVIGLSIGIFAHMLKLWQDGVGFTDVFRRPSHLATLPAYATPASRAGADPALDIESRALELAGSEVLGGSHGSAVRRAADDERAVREILRSLSPADRAQLNDVEPTLRSLVDRVSSLAQALHRLDADVRPEQLAQIDTRLADARAMPDGSPERDRRVSLLERQRATVAELAARRATLASQLESASLVLHTMRLDLLRLRSAGIGNASDVNNATQEARALSADIGRVLDAAAEVRKL